MNKKLKKLLKNPKKFFWDSNKYRPILIKLNLEGFFNDEQLKNKNGKIGIAATREHDSIKYPAERFDFPGWEIFDLYGENWRDLESDKPVAVMWGFNPWKRKFVSDYLPEYRTAYVRGNSSWQKLKNKLDEKKEFIFIAWGMSERIEVSDYALERKIPLYRMEDGFIRSATLGSQYSVAHSLVLDKQGIYFDATRTSDLECILNDFDFSKSSEKLSTAISLLNLLRVLKVSKYNLSSFSSPINIFGPKIKRRILVIGQVEGDASIKFGMAEGWSNERIIDLACLENPDADIFYKPHPDVLKGYRESSEKFEKIKKKCRILSEDLILADVFSEVDHVYTITSLSGFEALLHGLKVTVVGAPFYAGWGLTDDRGPVISRRRRKLTIEELFCGAYLIYPRYLSNLDNSSVGCLAAILGVTADRSLNTNKAFSEKIITTSAVDIGLSERWPVLLRSENFSLLIKNNPKKLVSFFSLRSIFLRCQGDHFQQSVAYLLVGKLKNMIGFSAVLHSLRSCIRPENFALLISDIWDIQPSDNILMHRAWVSEKLGDIESARKILNFSITVDEYKPTTNRGNGSAKMPLQPMLSLAQLELRYRNLNEANRLFNLLLLAGHMHGDIFRGLSEIARLRFDFASAAELLRIFNFFDPEWKKGVNQFREAQNQVLIGNLREAVESMSIACKLNPAYVATVGTTLGASNTLKNSLRGFFGTQHPYMDALVALIESEEGRNDLFARARALVANEDPVSASNLLNSYVPRPEEREQYCLMLSLSYRCQGDLVKAKSLIVQALQFFKTKFIYEEALEISVLKNEYDWGKRLLKEVDVLEINVSDKYRRKIALGLRDIKGCFLAYRHLSQNNMPKLYLGDRYTQSLFDIKKECEANVLVAACNGGPGDEIRFASLYEKMCLSAKAAKIDFTCDSRLISIFQRSLKNINFIPVNRIRSLDWLEDFTQYENLPGSDFHSVFDNSGWAFAQKADSVILSTDALADVIDGYESFEGRAYLKACPYRVSVWKYRLSSYKDKKLVGISWRSSLTNYIRNNDYLSVEELSQIFALDNIQFVNLQYDECSDELAWINEKFPGKILNFEDIDQFNDFEEVAALMSCLDLIVAPATTVVELAGALGCPTFLLSNASELHWRKLPGTEVDVWHNSIMHVEGEILGDKRSLSSALSEKIKSYTNLN